MPDPYAANLFGKHNPYYAKKAIHGQLVVVLDGRYENRGLQLIKPPSRAVRQGEIHELIVTPESSQPGMTVNPIAYVGFFVVSQGGVIVSGDEVRIHGLLLGTIAGFDETHMPNHLNIVITGQQLSGKEVGLLLDSEVVIGR